MISQFSSLNFGLGETANMIRESVNAFARDEIAPRAAEIDEKTNSPQIYGKNLVNLVCWV